MTIYKGFYVNILVMDYFIYISLFQHLTYCTDNSVKRDFERYWKTFERMFASVETETRMAD